MKLAIIRTSYNPINIQSYNVQETGLAKGLLNYGISTDFYSIFEDLDTMQTIANNNACKVNLIPLKKRWMFFGRITYFPKLINSIIKNNYDIVQVHEDSQLMTPFILHECHKHKIKTVLYQGMYMDYKGIKHIYQYFLDFLFFKAIQKCADIIFAKTPFAKKYLEEKGYKNILVLPIGLDYEKERKTYHSYEKLKDIKSQYDKILLYVGKIEKRRNPLFLIDILSHLESNIAMIIVGDGPMYAQMMEYAKKENVLGRLFVIKYIPNNEIHDVYKICNIFLLPTNYEIYGMVVMEALFNGLPVIATPEAGTSSILTDDKLGVCLSFDIEKWVNEILKYLNSDKTNLSSYRTEHVKNAYSWNTIAAKYHEIIISKFVLKDK
jgi:glycosyltransferase involved in cell wall biosynthesis